MINFKMDKDRLYGNITVVEGDNKSEDYIIELHKEVENKKYTHFDLTGKTLNLVIVDEKTGHGDIIPLEIYQATLGQVRLKVTNILTKKSGVYISQIQVSGTEGFEESFCYFQININKNLKNVLSGDIIANPSFTILNTTLEKVKTWDNYFKDVSPKLEEKYTTRLNTVSSELETVKVDKADKTQIWGMSNMGQDVKIAMTGGSVAVVGRDTILTENIVNKQITPEKTSFIIKRGAENIYIDKTYTDNKTLNNVGTMENNNNYFVSVLIPVNPNTKYVFSLDGNKPFTLDKVAQKEFNSLEDYKVIKNDTNVTSTTTATNCKFIAFTKNKGEIGSSLQFGSIEELLSKLVIQEGETPTPLQNPTLKGINVEYLDAENKIIKDRVDLLESNFASNGLIKNICKTKRTYKDITKTVTDNIVASEIIKNSLIENPIIYKPFQNGNLNNIFKYSSPLIVQGTGYPRELTVHEKNGRAYTVEFMAYCDKLEIEQYANNYGYSIEIDGEILGDYTNKGDGSTYYKLFTFPNIKHRHIKIYARGDNYFYSFRVNNVGSIYPYSNKKYKVLFEGDSITEGGMSGNEQLYSYCGTISKIFDWDLINFGVGGTGFVTNRGDRTTLIQRIPLIKEYKDFDKIIVCAGLNDISSTLSEVENAINVYFDAITKEFGNNNIIALSPFNPNPTIAINLQAVNGYVKKAALKNKIPFIDIINGETYNKYGKMLMNGLSPIITAENKNIFISSDGTHPVKEGAINLGIRLSEEIYRVISSI